MSCSQNERTFGKEGGRVLENKRWQLRWEGASKLGSLEQIHFLNCPSTSKCRFSILLLLPLKFSKFLMSFLEPRVTFSSNFASLFCVMRRNSCVLFHLNLCMLWTKGSHQSVHFHTFDCSHEN